jgi:uncharacterized protein YcfJ
MVIPLASPAIGRNCHVWHLFAGTQTPLQPDATVTSLVPACFCGRPEKVGTFDLPQLLQETFMNARLKNILALASVALAAQAVAQVTFYEQDNFRGQSFSTQRQIGDFDRFGFNDRASSVVVIGERWEVCENSRFSGRCVVLRAGRYPSLAAMGLNDRVSSARAISRSARVDDRRYAPAAVAAEVTFFEQEGFAGQSFTSDNAVENLQRQNFNDRASSAVVVAGQWEVCEDAGYRGRCVVLRTGRYPSLATMGLNDRVSSVRIVNGDVPTAQRRDVPAAVDNPDFRRRNNERLYEANVSSVRAVVGPPEQRCWVEQEQVTQDSRNSNVPGAIAGALLGGILGHQVGGGAGKDLATVGGAVAGAAIGANAGRNNSAPQTTAQDVQRCRDVPSQARPQFWDVTYSFRGMEHRVQLTSPPGPTVTVNELGEPRS